MCKICVFAGTSEGRSLVENLSSRGLELIVCVATEYGEVLLGEHADVQIRAGRMDARQMAEMLGAEKIALVIDATHPYADVVTENISSACESAGVEYMRLLRGSDSGAEDGVFVESTAACVEYLQGTQGNVLVTTGSKELSAFAPLNERVYARVLPMQASLESCRVSGVAPDHIIAMQGPFSEEMNLALLRMTQAKYIVTKDTGGAGGYGAKISAAKKAGAQPVIIGRPPQREGMDLKAMLSLLESKLALKPRRKHVALVGVGMANAQTRTFGMESAIHRADCLIGARRMLEGVDTFGKKTHIAVPAKEIARFIRESSDQRFAVLLSGDTGFYSGAKALLGELQDMDVQVLPGIGSLQYFCAQLKRPWEDVRALSLHGRECDFVGEVCRNRAVFALLGGDDGANLALKRLIDGNLGALEVCIGEKLGYPDERITCATAQELYGKPWNPLSVMLVENPRWGETVVTHGLPDDAFLRDETPMTKAEVRAISLSKLALTRNSVVYDVGSGSGSISVECALQAEKGKVYAIEMKEKALALTKKNAERFHLVNLEAVQGKAPDAFEALEAPTHAFIGGSGGSMREIIDALLKKNPHVRIVVNTVTLETLAELTEISREFDVCDIAEVSVSKPRELGRYRLMTAQNPVFIFTLQNREMER